MKQYLEAIPADLFNRLHAWCAAGKAVWTGEDGLVIALQSDDGGP